MIRQALCDSYKQEILRGVHRDGDEYWIALYTDNADLTHGTTTYSARAEVAGLGYRSGGLRLKGFLTGLDGKTAWLTFEDPKWPVGSITARGALIYNATRENRAVAVFDFGEDRSSERAMFIVQLPEPTSTHALIRL